MISVFSENLIRQGLPGGRTISFGESVDKSTDGKSNSISNESKSVFFVIRVGIFSAFFSPLFIDRPFFCFCSSLYIDPTSENVSDDASGAKERCNLSIDPVTFINGVDGDVKTVSVDFIDSSTD
jgi:hypothetical protein